MVDPNFSEQSVRFLRSVKSLYGKEAGAYGQNNTANQRATYDRGGWLDRIEYGLRAGSEYAQAAPLKVRFNTVERCLSGCWTAAAWQSSVACDHNELLPLYWLKHVSTD